MIVWLISAHLYMRIVQPWKLQVFRRHPRRTTLSQARLSQVVQHTLLLQVQGREPARPKIIITVWKYWKKIEINIIWNRRAENQREKVFRNLEELYIFNTRWWGWCWWWRWWRWWRWQRWGSITEGMLRQLLSSTRLRIVNLQLVNSLTDELFKVKFKMHQQKYKMYQHIIISRYKKQNLRIS